MKSELIMVKYKDNYNVENIYYGNDIQRKRFKRFIKFQYRINPRRYEIDIVCRLDNSKFKLGDCGTAACSLGHLPLFNPARFCVDLPNFPYYSHFDIRDKITDCTSYNLIAQEYFGLTGSQVRYCFVGPSYYVEDKDFKVQPKHVAKRMQGLLEGKIYMAKGYKG